MRLYPDDMPRPGGCACVFRLDSLGLLLRPADRDALLGERGDEQEYARLVGRVCKRILAAVPEGAAVLVACEGDDQLLALGPHRAAPFPQTPGGRYDRERPADGAAAVAHLETLRGRGAQFLVWPEPAFWWLKEHPELRRHLDTHYRNVHADADCVIYQLNRPPADGTKS
jgi:hypothetical protein